MHSGMIGKIEKAIRYSQEHDRVVFEEFRVTLEGDNRPHVVTYNGGVWSCDCETIDQAGYCSHTMTMERILGDMIQSRSGEGTSA
jgi:hypothetical protein